MSECKGKICPSLKVCNTSSGRCVLKSGKIGQSILKGSSFSSSSIKCPPDKIVNPSTGRCVLKSGLIGKKILASIDDDKKDDSVSGGIESLFKRFTKHMSKKGIYKKYGNQFEAYLPKDYYVVKQSGSGKFGTVYIACTSPLDCFALKLQHVKNVSVFMEEIEMQKLFHNHGLAPPIHGYAIYTHKGNKVGVIKMGKIVTTLSSLLRQRLSESVLHTLIDSTLDFIEVLCNNNLVHGDMHWDNIGINVGLDEKGEVNIYPVLIDFGWSSDGECRPELEVIQLLRTITLYHGKEKLDPYNVKYIRKVLYDTYVENYGSIPDNDSKINDLWGRMVDDYEIHLLKKSMTKKPLS
jgi:hypothetical protein